MPFLLYDFLITFWDHNNPMFFFYEENGKVPGLSKWQIRNWQWLLLLLWVLLTSPLVIGKHYIFRIVVKFGSPLQVSLLMSCDISKNFPQHNFLICPFYIPFVLYLHILPVQGAVTTHVCHDRLLSVPASPCHRARWASIRAAIPNPELLAN